MTARDRAGYSRLVMKALQPTFRRLAAMFVLVTAAPAVLAAQSPALAIPPFDAPATRGVFEDDARIELDDERQPTPAEARVQWVTFYQIYTDDRLARYAPGGAMGARFDLFQFGGFADAQPCGYRIHIVARNGHITLIGRVDSAGDRSIAETRARETAGTFLVDNALVVAEQDWSSR